MLLKVRTYSISEVFSFYMYIYPKISSFFFSPSNLAPFPYEETVSVVRNGSDAFGHFAQ